MASPKEVLDRHLQCFGEGDLEGVLADYAPEAVFFTPDGPLRGPEAIRPFFASLIAEFGRPVSSFRLTRQSFEGDYAYIVWTGETADNVYELASDMFVVRNDRIVAQSFAGKVTPKVQ
ncbi:MAG TPA: nuclear transport factor 2 family protein [Candidatus Polarisedimenticolaceae bacterium]